MGKGLSTKVKVAVTLVLSVLGLITFALIMQWRSEEELFAGNILVFSLINLNILALLVLVVLVGRNVVKLMFERKRGILGSKLRSRLMGSYVLIALVPMALSFLVSSGLISQAVQGWFNNQVDSIVTSSLTVARQYVSNAKLSAKAASGRISRELTRQALLEPGRAPALIKELEDLRHLNEMYSIRVVTPEGDVVAESAHATAEVESFAEPPLDIEAIRKAGDTKDLVRIEERGASQFVRVYRATGRFITVCSYRLDPEMVHAKEMINDAYGEYEELKGLKDPLRANFFLILALSNLLTLFGAIWIAFFVSKQITVPIQNLAEGTRSVAKGDYDFQLLPARDDEIGYLVSSFNQMLSDLKISRTEAERRGLLIQAILSHLGVGVIALGPDKRVTTVNAAAASLLELAPSNMGWSGLSLSELLQGEQFAQIEPLVRALEVPRGGDGQSPASESEIRVHAGGRELLLVCTAGGIFTSDKTCLGYVLLLDDITELSRAQHLAAWRDVARRIAHEIKNPLTPLQLSAQRLQKLLQGQPASDAITESTRSIVEHVEIIKRLANEFSEYGRMPTARFVPADLEALLRNSVTSLRNDHPDITIEYHADERSPEMLLDPEQIRGVLINILSNAVAAVQCNSAPDDRRIDVRLSFSRKTDRATIEISDSGPGIPAGDKSRIFEPYFTTKKGGTGLGLAIVSSVVSDHQGEIRVFDNQPRGARFVLSLPQHPLATTPRRLGGAGRTDGGA
jgi:two-component system nitrogen regulation sensor histidine kinase NtrY